MRTLFLKMKCSTFQLNQDRLVVNPQGESHVLLVVKILVQAVKKGKRMEKRKERKEKKVRTHQLLEKQNIHTYIYTHTTTIEYYCIVVLLRFSFSPLPSLDLSLLLNLFIYIYTRIKYGLTNKKKFTLMYLQLKLRKCLKSR